MKTNLKMLRICFVAIMCFTLFVVNSTAENMQYYYDSANRLVEVDFGGGQGLKYIYDQNGNLLKRSASDGKFFITHIDHTSQWETWLIIDNIGEESGRVELILYENGNQVSSKNHFVDAGKSKSIQIESGQCGVVTKHGEDILLREAFVNVNNKGVAEFALTQWSSNDLDFLLPYYHVENLTWMGLAFMNVGNQDTTASLTAYGPDGGQLAQTSVELGMNENAVGVLEAFFTELSFENVSRVHVSADQPMAGINISGFGTSRLLFTKAADSILPAGVHFIPHLANQWGTWRNYLVLDNLGDEAQDAVLRLYSNGELVFTYDISVSPQANTLVNINAYQVYNPDCGVLSTQSNTLAARLCYISHSGGTAEFKISSFSDTNVACNFPTYITSELEWMGIALFNTTPVSDTYTLRAMKSGNVVETTTMSLDGFSRKADILENIFPASYSGGIDRVMVLGNKPLFSIVISGSSLDRLLFMPGQIIH